MSNGDGMSLKEKAEYEMLQAVKRAQRHRFEENKGNPILFISHLFNSLANMIQCNGRSEKCIFVFIYILYWSFCRVLYLFPRLVKFSYSKHQK